MSNNFCGWYFRCQSEDHTIALIPAVHTRNGVQSSSLQIISDTGSFLFSFPQSQIERDCPHTVLGDNLFCESGIRLHLHAENFSIDAVLQFDHLTPIRYDIMGPFRFLPFMECRHSIFSMRHAVNGILRINGVDSCFDNSLGYIEGDRGHSFPKRYLWTQCFFPAGSLMLSVADIPVGPLTFTGIISVVLLHGKEYRLASYLGAQVLKMQSGEVVIRQGNLTLCAQLLEKTAYPLQAPANGAMIRTIRENTACRARYQLIRGSKTILSVESSNAAFEYEYSDALVDNPASFG